MKVDQIQYLEQRLLDQQIELLGVADLIEVSSQIDQGSYQQGAAIEAVQSPLNQTMAMANQDNQIIQLNRIASALDRIEVGGFGDCVECLKAIPEAILNIDPAIEYCEDCE